MEELAYHEAGHAYVAVYVGAKVRSVTIEPDDDDGPQRSGDTQVIWKRSKFSDQQFFEKSVLVALAGPVAEMIYTGDPFHPALVAEWAGDWADALKTAEGLEKDAAKRVAYLERTTLELYRLLNRDDHWAAVAALADHLLAHETLESQDIIEILDSWWC